MLRRCSVLWFELDSGPRFSLRSLAGGGTGLDESPRWLAHAAHLDAPVAVSADHLALLQRLTVDGEHARQPLVTAHGAACVEHLLETGLLIDLDDPASTFRERDDALRALAWWPPAAIAHTGGRWRDVDVVPATGNAGGLTIDEMLTAFGAPPDHVHRRGDSDATVALPAATTSPLDALLARRHTCRNFDPEATVSMQALSTMLQRTFAATGTRLLAPGAVAVRKNVPSGGAVHPVEAYLLLQRVDGIAPGMYHYLPFEHRLEAIGSPLDNPCALATEFVAGQHWFADAPVMLIMTARFDRLFWKYRRHAKAWRVAQLDAGHLSQTLYLSATELGLGVFFTCAVNDIAIEQALQLEPVREGVIGISGFGPAAAVRRTLELDPVTPVRC